MRRILSFVIVIALVGYGWRHHQQQVAALRSARAAQPAPAPAPASATPATERVERDPADSPRRCDGREYCSQMRSCEEATWFLQNCPGMKMDGDGDGIPCERQWCQGN